MMYTIYIREANLDPPEASTSLISSLMIPDPLHVYGDWVSSDVYVLY